MRHRTHRTRGRKIGFVAAACLGLACGDAPNAPYTLTVSPTSLTLIVPQEATLIAVTNAGGGGAALRWDSDGPTVARVSDAGVVRAVGQGAAWVHVWLAADANVRDSALVTTADVGRP